MQTFPTSPKSMLTSFWINRSLIAQMTKREVIGRYRGSTMGLAWSFLHPILMLAVYTFVFSVVFKSRWGGSGAESKVDFAVVLFAGMIMFGFFAECTNRAPGLILANVNFVKKVVFPLEILPMISLGAALFHSVISLGVLFVVLIVSGGQLHWTLLLAPLIFLPLILATLATSWLLASLGVFIRDVGQVVGIITTIMMFLSPMFYPVSALPEHYRPLIMLNPLAFIIEQARAVLIWGNQPDWPGLINYTVISFFSAWLSFTWFQKTRKGFADVL